MKTPSIPRGLPCTILPDDELWCVCGSYSDGEISGGGVLDWCYDKEDGEQLLAAYQQDPRYGALHVRKWAE